MTEAKELRDRIVKRAREEGFHVERHDLTEEVNDGEEHIVYVIWPDDGGSVDVHACCGGEIHMIDGATVETFHALTGQDAPPGVLKQECVRIKLASLDKIWTTP